MEDNTRVKDYLFEDLEQLIQTYSKRLRVSSDQISLEVVSHITSKLAKKAATSFLSSDEGTMSLGLSKRFPSMLEDKESSSIEELKAMEREKCKSKKQVALSQYVQMRKRTASEFSSALSEMRSASKMYTQDRDLVAILHYQCLPASETYRFSCAATIKTNQKDLAARILRAGEYQPQKDNTDYSGYLAALQQHSHQKFEINKLTFTDGVFCGAPDAVVWKKDQAAAAAEFKPLKYKSAGRVQLAVYLKILNLKSGWLVLENEGVYRVELVELNDGLNLDITKRLESFKSFRAQAAKLS